MISYTHMLSSLLMISFLGKNSLQKITREPVVGEDGLVSNQGGCLLAHWNWSSKFCSGSWVSLTGRKKNEIIFAHVCPLLYSAWCSKGRGMIRMTTCPSCYFQPVIKNYHGWIQHFPCASYYVCRMTKSFLGSCLQRSATWAGFQWPAYIQFL